MTGPNFISNHPTPPAPPSREEELERRNQESLNMVALMLKLYGPMTFSKYQLRDGAGKGFIQRATNDTTGDVTFSWIKVD